MRYVHLPIGYDGMAPERTLEIARAVHDLPGPIYLHCHHGKHRSAGAAGAAAVSLGMLTQDQALARMSVSGTAANYTGLFACVRAASPASPEVLARAAAEFPERARTTGLVQSMVEIDEAFESLKAIEKAGWKTPADHPDLVPAAVAGRMADLFRVLDEDPEVVAGSEEMRSWLREDAARSSRLEEGLLAPAPSHADLSALLKELNQSCKQCHAAYRD